MTDSESSLRITDLEILKILFRGVAARTGNDSEADRRRTADLDDSEEMSKGASRAICQLLEQISKRNQRLRQHEYDAWTAQLQPAIEEIKAQIPQDDTFILVDEDQWGTDGVVASRQAIPFLEKDGQYWGPPPDDETAIREFERLRHSGASFMVFAWPAFWWLDLK